MKEYSKQQNKLFIYDVATANKVDSCALWAYAYIESNFNNIAKTGSGSRVGLFQLGDGYGGIEGDDRYDPIKNTQGTINQYKINQAKIQKVVDDYKEYYTYMAHQQGLTGFLYILSNPNLPINSAKYKTNMLSNMPPNCKSWVKTCGDFLSCWEQRFNQIYNSCDLNDLVAERKKNQKDNNDEDKTWWEENKTKVIAVSVTSAIAIIALYISKKGKSKKSKGDKAIKSER